MMDNYCAPQWIDFTQSPQNPSDSYFNVEHEVHKPLIHIKSTVKPNLLLSVKENEINQQSVTEAEFDDSLESKSHAPTNIAFFIPHNDKKHSMEDVKKENELSKAIKDLNLDEKSNKIHQAWSISITELTNAFKKPTDHKIRSAMPDKIKNNIRVSKTSNSGIRKLSFKNIGTNNIKKANLQITTNNIHKSEVPDYLEDNLSEQKFSYKIMSLNRECPLFKIKQCPSIKSRPKILTCQYRRQSRRYSNQFISFAEAVSKFQNGTPQRFRTISNKNLKLGPLKLRRSPLKLTFPVSPALRCKQRTRHTTVSTKQELEQLEIEQMKKHRVKANPVPINVSKSSSVLKKVTKKPAAFVQEFPLNQSMNMNHTTSSCENVQQKIEDKECKSTVPIIPFTNEPNLVQFQNNKHQMNKEEIQKNLHVQKMNPAKEQIIKKATIPCPFSFEARNKLLAKKKEELIKQIQQQNNKVPVFHANPVPSFKSTLTFGSSKPNLQTKEKPRDSKTLVTKQTNSSNDQENKQPNVMTNSVICIDSKKNERRQHVISNKQKAEEIKNNTEVTEIKNKKQLSIVQRKTDKFQPNINKIPKERNKFNEIKKKGTGTEGKETRDEKNMLLKKKLPTGLHKLT